MKQKKFLLPLILSILLAVGIFLSLVTGFSNLSHVKWESVWNLYLEDVTVRPMTEQELPDAPSNSLEYYMIELTLSNNSPQSLDTTSCFDVVPTDGDPWAVNDNFYLVRSRFTPEMSIPAGCTGTMLLPIEVDPAELNGRDLDILFDYGIYEDEYIATVTLP